MSCVTHHHACECREAKVREMCQYLIWAGNAGPGQLSEFMKAVDAAVEIARELYNQVETNEQHL